MPICRYEVTVGYVPLPGEPLTADFTTQGKIGIGVEFAYTLRGARRNAAKLIRLYERKKRSEDPVETYTI